MLNNDNLGKKVEPDLFGVLNSIDEQVNHCQSLMGAELKVPDNKFPNTSLNVTNKNTVDNSINSNTRSR